MARYIDAEELELEYYGLSIHGTMAVKSVLPVFSELLKNQPTADVAEVKHAKWEINSDGYYPYCSNCKTEPKNGVMSKHCPDCGAKMDGGKEE